MNAKLLIIFSCLVAGSFAGGYEPEYHFAPTLYHGPGAPLDHKGRVIDTPEVAHAKAAHLAAHAAENAKTGYGGHAGGYGDYSDFSGAGYGGHGGHVAAVHDVGHHSYHGPAAPLAHDGRVIDTPEVAHAKANHLAAHAEELSKVSYSHQPAPYYSHL